MKFTKLTFLVVTSFSLVALFLDSSAESQRKKGKAAPKSSASKRATASNPTSTPDPNYVPCNCAAETPPAPKLGSENKNGYNFSWISDADKLPSGDWCYFRGVKNLGSGVVTVYLVAGGDRWRGVDVLPNLPNSDTTTFSASPIEPVKAFPLIYGETGANIVVEMFQPQQQAKAVLDPGSIIDNGLPGASRGTRVDTRRAIVSEIRRSLWDRTTNENYDILLTFNSRVEKLPKFYKYTVSMTNKGTCDLRVEWGAIKSSTDPFFLQQLSQVVQIRSRPDDPGVSLEKGAEINASSFTDRGPEISTGFVSIYKGKTLVAEGLAPTYIPSR